MKDRIMNESKNAISIGLGAGLMGVLCCVGPLIPILLGFGGASILFGLDAYRPWFIGGGVVIMTFASFYAVRRRNRCCSVKSHWKNAQLVFIIFGTGIATYAGMFYGVVPALASVANDNVDRAHQTGKLDTSPAGSTMIATLAGNQEENVSLSKASQTGTAKIRVTGMTCSGCSLGIKQAFLKLEGVSDAKIDYETATAEVVYNPSLIKAEALLNAPVADHYVLELVPLEAIQTFRIDGMTCAACIPPVKQAFLDLPGVIACKVDWQSGKTDVTYDSRITNQEQLAKAPIPENYRMHPAPDKSDPEAEPINQP